MQDLNMRRESAAVTFAIVIAAGLLGCSRPMPDCQEPGDNPGRLYTTALEAVERGDLDSAEHALDRALHCEPKFHVALSALALVMAMRVETADGTAQNAYRKRAHDDLDAGGAGLRSPEERLLHGVTAIRTLTALQDSRWLERAREFFHATQGLSVDESKLLYYSEREALPYFMAEACAAAGEYEKARDLYKDVFARHGVGRWNGKAEAAWRRTDKIVHATAGITPQGIGRQIAVQPSVTRAQLAALLVEDVGLGMLLKPPPADESPRMVPADTRDNPYREQIVTLLSWHLRGVELVYDNTAQAYVFQPDAPVRRKELAIALEDVVIRLTGDPSIAHGFVGHDKSLFGDIPPTAAWYNACATAVSRGLMESDVRGAFRPDAEVEGADALLAARVLRQEMIHN
jgi:hypothetical protein